MVRPELVAASTWHGRSGAVRHAFRYRIDFVLIDPEAPAHAPLFRPQPVGRWPASTTATMAARRRRRGRGLGATGSCRGGRSRGLPAPAADAAALVRHGVQPGELLARVPRRGAGRGDRRGQQHLWRPPQLSLRQARVRADRTRRRRHGLARSFTSRRSRTIAGRYAFSFDIRDDAIAIRIAHRNGGEGLVATLEGRRLPLTAPRRAPRGRPLSRRRTSRHRADPLAGAAALAQGRAIPAAAASARRGRHHMTQLPDQPHRERLSRQLRANRDRPPARAHARGTCP